MKFKFNLNSSGIILPILAIAAGTYLAVSYYVLPIYWRHYEHHPQLQKSSKLTQTKQGIPGDPLNIGLIGTQKELITALTKIGWYPADPLTLRSVLKVTTSVLLDRPYPNAPVSNLYLLGRKEDLAFEQPIGKSPKMRHHVRFWCSDNLLKNKRQLWLGAATFDRNVGLNKYTGQITHHIDSDIDIERDGLIDNLKKAGHLSKIYQITGVSPTLNNHNGEGDWYYTDGELTIGILSINNVIQIVPPESLPNPSRIEFKNKLWKIFKNLIKQNK
jgi:hypothetical protein